METFGAILMGAAFIVSLATLVVVVGVGIGKLLSKAFNGEDK